MTKVSSPDLLLQVEVDNFSAFDYDFGVVSLVHVSLS